MNDGYPSKPQEEKSTEKRASKFIVAGALALATITGTWGGTKGGFTPFYNVKIGTSYGINLGIRSDYSLGAKHYGIDLSIFRDFVGGKLYGVGFSFLSAISPISKIYGDGYEIEDYIGSEINGLEVSVLNIDVDGLKKVNGLQVGLLNQASAGSVVQIGGYNSTSSGEFPLVGEDNRVIKRGALLNYAFEDKE